MFYSQEMVFILQFLASIKYLPEKLILIIIKKLGHILFLFMKYIYQLRNLSSRPLFCHNAGMDDIVEQKSVRTKKKRESKKMMTLDDVTPTSAFKTPLDVGKVPTASPQKKKTTYVSLYGKDGESRINAVLLPGRNVCECQAQKHT